MLSKQEPANAIRPQHYGGAGNPYEVYKVLEAWGLDRDFYLGNTVKYIARCGKKDAPLQELQKAVWYLNRRIETLIEAENGTSK